MHSCSVPGCSVSAPAASMFNIARKETGGKLVVLCRRHVLDARRSGLTVYRLDRTLALDRKREEERVRAGAFFEAFKQANGNAAANGRRPASLPSHPLLDKATTKP